MRRASSSWAPASPPGRIPEALLARWTACAIPALLLRGGAVGGRQALPALAGARPGQRGRAGGGPLGQGEGPHRLLLGEGDVAAAPPPPSARLKVTPQQRLLGRRRGDIAAAASPRTTPSPPARRRRRRARRPPDWTWRPGGPPPATEREAVGGGGRHAPARGVRPALGQDRQDRALRRAASAQGCGSSRP